MKNHFPDVVTKEIFPELSWGFDDYITDSTFYNVHIRFPKAHPDLASALSKIAKETREGFDVKFDEVFLAANPFDLGDLSKRGRTYFRVSYKVALPEGTSFVEDDSSLKVGYKLPSGETILYSTEYQYL